ncbi:MAG TPA: twin transmembrane helix small protein [Nevskiaceae bacterium]|nr:twin transmembrane helix small protein [Nevskiaceae bacterium]
MFVKLVMIAFILAIVVALLFGGYFVVKDPGTKRRALYALSWRVGLQAALILFLVLAFFMGWIEPHPVGG